MAGGRPPPRLMSSHSRSDPISYPSGAATRIPATGTRSASTSAGSRTGRPRRVGCSNVACTAMLAIFWFQFSSVQPNGRQHRARRTHRGHASASLIHGRDRQGVRAHQGRIVRGRGGMAARGVRYRLRPLAALISTGRVDTRAIHRRASRLLGRANPLTFEIVVGPGPSMDRAVAAVSDFGATVRAVVRNIRPSKVPYRP
jgi:hypothetical protein